MSIKFNPSLLSIALLSAYSCASFAQTNAPAELPTVVVTASRLPQTLSDTIANTTLISRADIERSGAVDLPSLLSGHAGVEIGRSGGYGQQASIFMRGANSNHTLVLVDGIAINENVSGAAGLENLALDTIDRIEIVRGNVSAQYGSQAIGGVIQVFTRNPSAGMNGGATFELGTQGHKKLNIHVSGGSEATQLSVTATRFLYDGVSAQVPAQFTFGANADKDGTAQSIGSFSLTHKIAPTVKLFAGATISDLKAGIDGYYDPVYSPGPLTDKDTLAQRNNLAKIGAVLQILPNWEMTVQHARQTLQAVYETNGVVNDWSYESKRNLTTVGNALNFGVLGQVFVGLDLQKNQIDKIGTHANRSGLALTSTWSGKQSSFGWNTALRFDKGQASEKSNTNYQLGGSYDLTPEWSLRGQTSTAFNRPTLDQLYGYGANPLLNAETSKNQEFGMQWNKAGSLLRLTAFRSRTRDLIDSICDINWNCSNININASTNKGIELIAETPLPWSGGKLKTNLNHQNPVNEGTGEALSRRAKFSASIAIEGRLGAWYWNTTLKHQGKRDDSAYNDNTMLSYKKLDANIGYTINAKTSVSLALSNLGKANDQTAYGYSGTPRGAVLRLNYKL